MKAIKNKKRFDPRYFMNERTEREAIKEYHPGDGSGPEHSKDLVAPRRKVPSTEPPKNPPRNFDPLDGFEEGTGEPERGADGKPRGKPVEEDCGDPEMGPEEAGPAVTDLSPDEAFGAGYTSAVEEIMASIEGLLDDPMDMSVGPEDEGESALVVTQLPDHAMEISEEGSAPVEEPVESALIDALVDKYQEKRDGLDQGVRKAISDIIAYRANRSETPKETGDGQEAAVRRLDMRGDNLEEA